MIASFEHKGYWWLPDRKDIKIPGVWRFTPEEGNYVDLIGSFGLNKKKISIINGLTVDGTHVTFYNSFVTYRRRGSRGGASETIFTNFAISGPVAFSTQRSLRFDRSSIFLKNLDEWVNMSHGFKIDHEMDGNQLKSIQTKYTLPPDIEIQIQDKFKIAFFPSVQGPSTALVQKEVRITQRIGIRFHFARRMSFDDILLHYSQFERLLILFSQTPTYPLQFYAFIKRERSYQRFEIFFQTVPNKKKTREVLPFDFIVPFKFIQDRINAIVISWFESHATLETCYIPYFNNFYGKSLYTADKFLNMCRALEAFHRDTISAGKNFSFQGRVLQVLRNNSLAYGAVLKIKNKVAFAEKIKKFRNDLTHSNPLLSSRDKVYLDIHLLTEKLTVVVTCALLNYHGLGLREIRKYIKESGRYSHFVKRRRKSSP